MKRTGGAMGQDIFDVLVVLTLAFFTWRGLANGLVGEAAGIVSLVGGFFGARAWNGYLSPHLQFIADPAWRAIAAYVIIFIAIMLAIGLLARILKKIIAFSFISWADKLCGAVLGFAKGVLIWALIFILLIKMFGNAEFLQDSRALPYFKSFVEYISQWLPPEIAAHLRLTP